MYLRKNVLEKKQVFYMKFGYMTQMEIVLLRIHKYYLFFEETIYGYANEYIKYNIAINTTIIINKLKNLTKLQ
jgi:hypothetical protein